MEHDKLIEDLANQRIKAQAMGGATKLAARRAQGLLNARERIAALCDPGSFSEIGEFVVSSRPQDAERTPADGIVTGYGAVDGRDILVASFDLTTLGASSAAHNMAKLAYLREHGNRSGIPCVFLIESAGARMPDIQGARGMGRIGLSGQRGRDRGSPWISAVLGPCYGMGTWYAVQSDVAIMRRGASMSVSSPKVTSVALSEDVTAEQLGGWEVHARTTGQIDIVVDTDEEALAMIRRTLGYLPSHIGEVPPVQPPDRVTQPGTAVEAALPVARHKVYDVRKVLEAIADEGSLQPWRELHGRPLFTGFLRIGGRPVGVIASNPLHKGGAIDGAACDKSTEFIVLCDTFNLPILLMADTPGFMVGMKAEHEGVAGKIMNNLQALIHASVPKIGLIMRKSYGQAYLNMGGGLVDAMAVWTTGEIGFVDPAVAVSVVHNARPGQQGEDYAAQIEQMKLDGTPYDLTAIFAAHAVIRPNDSREWLIRMLSALARRPDKGLSLHKLASWPTSL
jgi:acetyl-CoA carboxylase carboxyltransferase component